MGGGAIDRAHMLQRGSLIRVWVVIRPRRTERKVPSLWVWVGSHPRRTETLWFIYIKVHKHKETKFSEHMVCCFVDKVMKFGEGSVQTARVTGQKVGVWVVLHPRRTGKVKVKLSVAVTHSLCLTHSLRLSVRLSVCLSLGLALSLPPHFLSLS